MTTRWVAKWLCVRLGNLAVRLAPHAGLDLVFRVGRPKGVRPMAGGVIQRRIVPDVFDIVCQNCREVEWIHGHMGVDALTRTCGACGAQRWRVKPHIDHQQSRKV
jgi:hypothetical protein